MLQIAIWGICIMLVVKALDVFHKQAVATSPEKIAPRIALAAVLVAVLGAVLLFFLADAQVSDTRLTSGSSYGDVDPMSEAEEAALEAEVNELEAMADELDAETTEATNR